MSQTSEMHVLKSARGRLQWQGKRGITPSIGMHFGQMKTCWKEDFMHLALDQLFGAIPNLDREENPWKKGSDEGQQRRRWRWCERWLDKFPLSVIDYVQHEKWNKSCMEHLHLLHEGPWLRINEKVCKKVELYDSKWSALREATRSFILYILIWPSTLHSLIGISSNIVPLL